MPAGDNIDAASAADTTTLAEIPDGQQAQVASLTQQADTQAVQADAAAKKSAEESARIQAAKDAKTKKDAADEAVAKAKKEREKAKELAASRSATRDASSFAPQSSYSISQIQSMARQMMPADQFQCFSNIVTHESGWNYKAVNPSTGAYGLVQALPGSKMVSAGADWQTNPATQLKWGLNYMNGRYHSPCGAWTFWQANTWY